MTKSILIVDDDPRVREVLIQRLRNRGYTAVGADSCAEALEKLAATSFDVLLLDLIMPRRAGVEVLQELATSRHVPRCIVMSGVAELWKKANPAIPVAGVLQKPFAFEELLKLIA